jgi:hypothetical protein
MDETRAAGLIIVKHLAWLAKADPTQLTQEQQRFRDTVVQILP